MAQIISMGGQATEWTYPYTSYFGSAFSCHNSTTPIVKLTDYVVLPSNIYEPVLLHVGKVGPLVVAVDASTWGKYESGVYNGCNQTNPDLDHAVQLVGYGKDKITGTDFWLIRNSWSPLWGEEGYIRIARQSSPFCGTDIHPSDGMGCKNGPSEVTVCGTCGILFDTAYPIIA